MLRQFLYRLWGVDHELNDLADEFNAPRAWVICPHCGSQNWRFPPHGIGEPCPLLQGMADSVGLRFDAERNLAIGSRQQMEEVTKFMRRQMGLEGEEDE